MGLEEPCQIGVLRLRVELTTFYNDYARNHSGEVLTRMHDLTVKYVRQSEGSSFAHERLRDLGVLALLA